MAFLNSIWSIAAVVVLAVAFRFWSRVGFRFPFAIGGFLILVVGSVFGYEFFKIDQGPIPITIDRLLLALIVGGFACLCLRRRESVRSLDATDLVIGALFIVLTFSALSTDWSYANNRPLSRLIFYYLMPISLYFVVKNARIDDRELGWIAAGITVFCLYLGVTAIFEWRGWYSLVFPTFIRDPLISEFFGRGRGPFLNPVSNGLFLTTGLSAAMLLWWNSNWKGRVLAAAAIPALVVGVVATLTRSVWLGMAAGAGLVVWIPGNRRQRAGMMIATVGCGLVLLLALGQSLISFKRDRHVTAEQMAQSAQLRPIFAAVAWDMFKDRPLLGCGLGQYGRARMDYIQEPNTEYELRKAASYFQHNVFLSLLTETGLIGCGLQLLLFIRIYQTGWRLWRNHLASNWARCYALIMIATLTAFLINGMFHDVSIIPMANMLVFFLLAIVGNLQSSYADGIMTYDVSGGADLRPMIQSAA